MERNTVKGIYILAIMTRGINYKTEELKEIETQKSF